MKRCGGRRPAHGAAEVHAAAGDRDDRRVGLRRRRAALGVVDLRVAATDVDRGLADLADALRGRDDARQVVVVREVFRLADRRPDHRRALEDGRAGGEAERGQQHRRRGDAARGVRGQRHEPAPRDRLALEGARDVAVGRVLRLRLLAGLRQGRWNAIARRARGRSRSARQAPRHRRLAASWSGAGPPATAAAPASQTASARAGSPSACACAQSAITSASSATASRSPMRREPLEAERVEAVAGEQREVGVLGPHDAAGAVVLQVALADRLDEQRIGLAARRRRRRRGGCGARRRRLDDRRRQQAALVAQRLAASALAARSCDLGERRRGRLDRARDVLGGVRGGGEPGLELRGRRVDAAGQQRAAPGAVGLEVAGARRPRSRRAARRRRRRSAGRWWTVTETGRSPAASRRPSASARVVSLQVDRYACSSSSASVARPAATASGFPLSVPAW